jgi:hypothetical protein
MGSRHSIMVNGIRLMVCLSLPLNARELGRDMRILKSLRRFGKFHNDIKFKKEPLFLFFSANKKSSSSRSQNALSLFL